LTIPSPHTGATITSHASPVPSSSESVCSGFASLIQLSLQSATSSPSVSKATGIDGVSAVQLPSQAITHVAIHASPQ